MAIFVLTGKGYDRWGNKINRDVVKGFLRARGHSVAQHVNYGVDYLVDGIHPSFSAPTQKQRDAARYSIPAITYPDMYRIVENGSQAVSEAAIDDPWQESSEPEPAEPVPGELNAKRLIRVRRKAS